MDWPAFLNDTNRQLASFREAQPEAQQGFAQLARAATRPGALDPKTKELIALAIGIAAHCDACIGFHVRAARRHGAAREEIAETVAMCLYMGGGPSLMYGAKALDAFDQFAAAETA
ncbi:MAG: carboxymuconolactone decarboxylase family protein [Pseudomonadota bacterium]|nr:carboxymuconolactone decarboxylase family protein [Pseudomonadota bacterium]MEE3100391.1 carboxymuconolactone decarboxylase family protein [Pseudomonadota bacterium]